MSKNIRYILFIGLIALAVSCKKKTPEDIGLIYLPDSDLLNAEFTDTVTLITHTVRDDSILTFSVSPLLLGIFNDPVFGITTSSIYTQLSIPTGKTNPSFGAAPSLDSAVLSLVYNKAQYGTLHPQKFKVYEVTDQMSATAKYYSDTTLSYSTEIGSAYLVPNVKDSVVLAKNVKFPPHLRITLDKNFCQKFLTDPTFTSSYNSSSDFQKFFKGIYIATSSGVPSGQGSILYMEANPDATKGYSRLTLYYNDSLSYYFGITKTDCARFTHFEHDYSSATDIKNQLNTAATIQEDKVFVQPMAGVRTKITMPYIKNLFNNGKVAINKAELILSVDPLSLAGGDSIYSPHPKLVATIADSVRGPVFMPDYFEGAVYFGGVYDAVKKEYRFNIARYLQQVLNGSKVNQGIYIITNARPTTANRVQLIGGNKSLANHTRLKITYTPLE